MYIYLIKFITKIIVWIVIILLKQRIEMHIQYKMYKCTSNQIICSYQQQYEHIHNEVKYRKKIELNRHDTFTKVQELPIFYITIKLLAAKIIFTSFFLYIQYIYKHTPNHFIICKNFTLNKTIADCKQFRQIFR